MYDDEATAHKQCWYIHEQEPYLLLLKNNTMKKIIFKLSLLAAICFSGSLLITGCSKDSVDNPSTSTGHDYFVNNMLGKDLTVTSAIDNNTDITADFSGYTFHLTDTATLSGTISAANFVRTTIGVWTVDAAYSKITFSFPSAIPILSFMTKQWQFTGNTSVTIDLSAANGETDVLHFSKK
jgi:hypothetical protein